MPAFFVLDEMSRGGPPRFCLFSKIDRPARDASDRTSAPGSGARNRWIRVLAPDRHEL